MATLRAGLIGAHISRTRLPAALEILCETAGWTLDFQLIDTAKRPDFDFDARMKRAVFEEWRGMTVTHPWKTHARKWVGAGMQADVAHLGACNTVVFGDAAVGFNTDYSGFLAAFQLFDAAPGRVVMIGAGGVAEALAPALMSLGASDLVICDMDIARAQKLAKNSGARAVSLDDLPDAVAHADGLINATPMGMAEYPGSAFDPTWLGTQTWAFDAVYTPTNTEFLNDATKAGLHCLSGFALFQSMAIRSFEAYTGLTVDPEIALPLLAPLCPE